MSIPLYSSSQHNPRQGLLFGAKVRGRPVVTIPMQVLNYRFVTNTHFLEKNMQRALDFFAFLSQFRLLQIKAYQQQR